MNNEKETFDSYNIQPGTHRWFEELFSTAGVRWPALLFHSTVLDKEHKHLRGIEYPLREVSRHYVSGCYAWLEEGQGDTLPQCIYVGKALRLGNRIMTHWNSQGKFLLDWYEDEDRKNASFIPYVAVWLTSERAALEVELHRRLKPKYNFRCE